MFRAVKSLSKFGRQSQSTLRTSACSSKLSTSVPQHSTGEQDGEPEFLEMVKVFADNAHSLALDKLLSTKPQPGKKAEETNVREKHIRGMYTST